MDIKYVTVKQLVNMYPFLNEGGVRSLIFNREKNGFDQCMIKLRKKILIDLEKFDAWIQSHKKG